LQSLFLSYVNIRFQGTLIRVFEVATRRQLTELRRGADTAVLYWLALLTAQPLISDVSQSLYYLRGVTFDDPSKSPSIHIHLLVHSQGCLTTSSCLLQSSSSSLTFFLTLPFFPPNSSNFSCQQPLQTLVSYFFPTPSVENRNSNYVFELHSNI
jgi:hypothetical protein